MNKRKCDQKNPEKKECSKKTKRDALFMPKLVEVLKDALLGWQFPEVCVLMVDEYATARVLFVGGFGNGHMETSIGLYDSFAGYEPLPLRLPFCVWQTNLFMDSQGRIEVIGGRNQDRGGHPDYNSINDKACWRIDLSKMTIEPMQDPFLTFLKSQKAGRVCPMSEGNVEGMGTVRVALDERRIFWWFDHKPHVFELPEDMADIEPRNNMRFVDGRVSFLQRLTHLLNERQVCFNLKTQTWVKSEKTGRIWATMGYFQFGSEGTYLRVQSTEMYLSTRWEKDPIECLESQMIQSNPHVLSEKNYRVYLSLPGECWFTSLRYNHSIGLHCIYVPLPDKTSDETANGTPVANNKLDLKAQHKVLKEVDLPMHPIFNVFRNHGESPNMASYIYIPTTRCFKLFSSSPYHPKEEEKEKETSSSSFSLLTESQIEELMTGMDMIECTTLTQITKILALPDFCPRSENQTPYPMDCCHSDCCAISSHHPKIFVCHTHSLAFQLDRLPTTEEVEDIANDTEVWYPQWEAKQPRLRQLVDEFLISGHQDLFHE
jgi:hypothetical protein